MGAGSGSGAAAASGFNQNIESVGLATISTTVPYAGPYFVKGKLTLPTLVGGSAASSILVTINQNGSPVYTGLAGAEGFYKNLSCAAYDVIAVVFSSSVTTDQALNVMKSVISIGQGQ
jgi:hypothetical protein